jgi:ribonucleoside-diphosphate reductase 2
MTKEFLKQNKVEFEEINVDENEEALEIIKEKGFKNLPVVIVSNKGFVFEFDGFQMDLLEGLVEK